MSWAILFAALGAVVGVGRFTPSRAADPEPTAQQVFERRILPIFNSPNPSSCTQCHLAAVDLKNYLLPSHEKSFLSLRDLGLIDLQKPEQSKILRLIQMGVEDHAGPALLHQKVREAEYGAFAAWIKASCADPRLRDAPPLAEAERSQPVRPVEVIRHARKDRLLESFENTVWVMRFRCMTCHIEGSEPNKKYQQEFGERVAWIKAAGPEATMNYVLSSKLIDRNDPAKSPLLLKPLGELEHKGGKKFVPGDLGYQAFRTWLEDYARTVRDEYPSAESLPKVDEGVRQLGTEMRLRLTDTPPAWGDRILLVTVHAWDQQKNAWQSTPVATSDRAGMHGGRPRQNALILFAARDTEQARNGRGSPPLLPPGKYLLKVYVDLKGRVAQDWRASLGRDDEFVGQVEITASWAAGSSNAVVVPADRLKP